MRLFIFSISILSFLIVTGMKLYTPVSIPAHAAFRGYLLKELDQCIESLKKNSNTTSNASLKRSYQQARCHYKRVEFVVEYISSKEAKYYINGPLVPKYDPDMGNEILHPQGFQPLEQVLYSGDSLDLNELRDECQQLILQLEEIKEYYQTVELSDGQLLEMMQIELFRMAALSFNGYDATISLDGIRESFWVLEGMEASLRFFKAYASTNNEALLVYHQLLKKLTNAKTILKNNTDYNSFDRINFITDQLNPLNECLVLFHNASSLPWSERKQALKLTAQSLFEKNSFNRQYFSIYYEDTLNIHLQASLGKLLFFDTALSLNNELSCASCHNPSKAFSDGRKVSINTGKLSGNRRNTPSIIDVVFQKSFFYDGRAYQLEQQIFDVVHNQNEMQSTLEKVVNKLNKSREYKKLFAEAFPSDKEINPYSIQKAIAEYEKTLVSFNSPFDQYLKGDKSKLSKQAIDGYNLFAGKALCGSCHFFPVFNGTVPPAYNDSEFEVLGIPSASSAKEIDSDLGRFEITGIKEFNYAFKTPTVRNSALTAPYMHNGIYNTLEEVIDFYHKGGGKGMGFAIENQTLPFNSLDLNDYEKKAILSFLYSLTDTTGLTSRPEKLPLFEEEVVLNNRKSNY